MKFTDQLDRALGLKKVFEAINGELLGRETWMTADPDQLARVATTGSRKVFWDALRKIVQETGDQALLKAIDAGDPEVLSMARREARRYANERRVGAQRGSELATRQQKPDTLGMSPEQIAAAKQKNVETAAGQPKKTYADEKLWGVFDGNGRLVQGGFNTQAEADAAVAGDPTRYPEPDAVTTQEYENEKSLTKLSNVKGPLQNGWTEDEVVKAMMPYIRYHARKYTSNKSEFEDLVQHGAIGVVNALRTDKAEAPFGSHAWRHILGEIRRAAMTGGVIKGSDIPGAGGAGQKGGTTGYRLLFQKDKASPTEKMDFPSDPSAFQDYFSKTGRHPPRSIDPGFKAATAKKDELVAQGYVVGKIQDIRGSMASADAPTAGTEGEGATLGSGLKATKVKTPYQIAMNRDQIQQLLSTSKMSDQQKKVLMLTFGLDQSEAGEGGTSWGSPETRVAGKYGPPESGEAGREPGTQAGQAPGAAGFDPNTSQMDPTYGGDVDDKGKQTGYPVSVVRGPVEVGRMLGISTTKVRQHRAKALHWLQQAAQEREWEHMRKRMARQRARGGAGGPEELGGDPYSGSIRHYSTKYDKPGKVYPTKPSAEIGLDPNTPDVRSTQHPRNKPMTPEAIEDREYQSLREVQDIIRFFIIESIITGDINGTILSE